MKGSKSGILRALLHVPTPMESRASLLRRLRDQKEEIYFLRDALYVASGGTFEETIIPIQTPRREEKTGKTDIDSFVRSLLTD